MNRETFYRSVMALIVGMIFHEVANAQCCSVSIDKHFQIPDTDKVPEIDGRILLEEWSDAVILDDLHQVSPVEFSAASERTAYYFKYDKNQLFVAVHAYDSEPEKIIAQVLKQGGSLFSDDHVVVLIDSSNNDRSGYHFQLNPNGVRADALYTNGTNADDNWDGVWRGAARKVEDGWTAEFSIPFKTISYNPDSDTWGVTFWRNIERKNEKVAWTSFAGNTNPTTAGSMSGIKELSQGLGLDLIPSLSMTFLKDRVGNPHPIPALNVDPFTQTEVSPSLDLIYKLTPSMNLTVTLNTDFAATEIDGRQLDLGRVSPTLPEKRSFFLTDFDIFEFGEIGRTTGIAASTNANPFYSRRIGIGADGEVDIVGGLKLSGRLNTFDVGALYMRQDSYTVLREDRKTNQAVKDDYDASDLLVLRMLHPFMESSTLGAMLTYGDPKSNDESSTIAVDFSTRNKNLLEGRSVDTLLWLQKSNNPGVDSNDYAWNVALSLPSRDSWTLGAQIHEVQENYDPRLGNVSQEGVRLYSIGYSDRWIFSEQPWIRDISTSLSFNRWNFLDTGELKSQEWDYSVFRVQTPRGDQLSFSLNNSVDNLRVGERRPLSSLGIRIPFGEHEYNNGRVSLRTASSRPVSVDLTFNYGDYYTGKRETISPTIEWRPNANLSFEAQFSYDKYHSFPVQQIGTNIQSFPIYSESSAIVREIDLENEIVFNDAISLTTTIQYDNLSEDIGINTRFRWGLAPGQDIWFVLSHNMVNEFSDLDEDGLDDDSGYESTTTNAAFKIRYTYRF